MLARLLGFVGRVMMATGAILLLFVAYELWGTGIHAAQEQERIADEFAAMQERFQAAQQAGTDTTEPASEPPATAAPDQPVPDGVPVPAGDLAGLPALEPGDPVGRIRIPRIGVDWMMIEGVPLWLLRNGPGHFPETPFPGQAGNAAIAGHRTTFGAPFNRLDELEPGDTIEVETLQGSFTYEVMPHEPGANAPEPGGPGHQIVRPWDMSVLKDFGDNRITLVACHPEYSARLRIVVHGRLVDEPAPTPPTVVAATPSTPNAFFGEELVGGDRSAWPGAIAFGAASLAVWLAAWLLARHREQRWQRWALYAAAVPPFLVLLFFTFEHVTRLLPAAY